MQIEDTLEWKLKKIFTVPQIHIHSSYYTYPIAFILQSLPIPLIAIQTKMIAEPKAMMDNIMHQLFQYCCNSKIKTICPALLLGPGWDILSRQILLDKMVGNSQFAYAKSAMVGILSTVLYAPTFATYNIIANTNPIKIKDIYESSIKLLKTGWMHLAVRGALLGMVQYFIINDKHFTDIKDVNVSKIFKDFTFSNPFIQSLKEKQVIRLEDKKIVSNSKKNRTIISTLVLSPIYTICEMVSEIFLIGYMKSGKINNIKSDIRLLFSKRGRDLFVMSIVKNPFLFAPTIYGYYYYQEAIRGNKYD